MFRIALAYAGLLLGSSSLVFAADCAGLKSLRLADTTITVAESVTSGTLEVPDADVTMHNLPAFCRVAGEFHPTSDSRIGFEVWLPEKE